MRFKKEMESRRRTEVKHFKGERGCFCSYLRVVRTSRVICEEAFGIVLVLDALNSFISSIRLNDWLIELSIIQKDGCAG